MESKAKYFNVPIAMLRGVLIGEKDITDFVQDIVKYSLYRYATHLPYSEDTYENGMQTQIKAAAKFMNVKMSNIGNNIQKGSMLFEKYGEKCAFCDVDTGMAWNFHDNPKTEREIAQFCAFCATKSIIGKAEYKRTNKNMIIARMFGYSTFAEFEQDEPNLTARNISKKERNMREMATERRGKYRIRYHIDRVLTDLELHWGLKRYADHMRGMFISYTSDIKTLSIAGEKSKRKVQEESLIDAKRKAKEEALRILNRK